MKTAQIRLIITALTASARTAARRVTPCSTTIGTWLYTNAVAIANSHQHGHWATFSQMLDVTVLTAEITTATPTAISPAAGQNQRVSLPISPSSRRMMTVSTRAGPSRAPGPVRTEVGVEALMP